MAKPRHPTPEERKLWRDTTKHDARHAAHANDEPEDEPLPEPAVTPPIAVPHPPKKQLPRPPGGELKPLDTRHAKRLLKTHARVEATLDLHGLGKTEAYLRVKRFVTLRHAAGCRHVVIITGKGRAGEGVLRANLPHWLNETPLRSLISAMAHAVPEKGGSGVLHVLLKVTR